MTTESLLYSVSHEYWNFTIQGVPWILKVYYTGCPMNTKGLLYRWSYDYWKFTIQGVSWILKVYYTWCLVNTESLLYRVSREYWRFTIQGVPWILKVYYTRSSECQILAVTSHSVCLSYPVSSELPRFWSKTGAYLIPLRSLYLFHIISAGVSLFLLGCKSSGVWSGHSHQPNVKFKYMWSCTSTPPDAFRACTWTAVPYEYVCIYLL
jgi:hypothetical protein